MSANPYRPPATKSRKQSRSPLKIHWPLVVLGWVFGGCVGVFFAPEFLLLIIWLNRWLMSF